MGLISGHQRTETGPVVLKQEQITPPPVLGGFVPRKTRVSRSITIPESSIRRYVSKMRPGLAFVYSEKMFCILNIDCRALHAVCSQNQITKSQNAASYYPHDSRRPFFLPLLNDVRLLLVLFSCIQRGTETRCLLRSTISSSIIYKVAVKNVAIFGERTNNFWAPPCTSDERVWWEDEPRGLKARILIMAPWNVHLLPFAPITLYRIYIYLMKI